MINVRRVLHKSLTPLEQLLMDYVWTHPECTAEMCREGVAPRRLLKDSTIRTILRKLEEKGYLTHVVDGRTFVYTAANSRRNVAVQAVQQLLERFCDGSLEELLVGMVDNQVLEPKQLQRLAEKIAARRSAQAQSVVRAGERSAQAQSVVRAGERSAQAQSVVRAGERSAQAQSVVRAGERSAQAQSVVRAGERSAQAQSVVRAGERSAQAQSVVRAGDQKEKKA